MNEVEKENTNENETGCISGDCNKGYGIYVYESNYTDGSKKSYFEGEFIDGEDNLAFGIKVTHHTIYFGDLEAYISSDFDDELNIIASEMYDVTCSSLEKLGKNDKCHCGSGVKYKKCHMDIDIEEYNWIQEANDCLDNFIAINKDKGEGHLKNAIKLVDLFKTYMDGYYERF